MAIRSPGVYPRESDFSELAPALGLATFAVIGGASKGKLNSPTLYSSESELVGAHGKPLLNDYALQAAIAFLRKGNRLSFTRIANGAATADIPIPGLSGGTPAVAAAGTVAFSSSTNPVDGDTLTLRKGVPRVNLENDANGALGNVAITLAGSGVASRISASGLSGGTSTARATGNVKFIGSVQPADGDQVIISDGVTSVTFEFDSNSSVTESANNRQVVIGATSYATMTALIAKITAHAFNVSGTDAVVQKVFEFDSNAAFTPGNVGVLIGTTAAATLLNLITAINNNVATLGMLADNATITVPTLSVTQGTGGIDGNSTIAKVGSNIVVTGFTGGVAAVAGSNVTALGILAGSPGSWGNSLQVTVAATTTIGAPGGNFDLFVKAPVDDSGVLQTVERFNNLSLDSANARFIETVLVDGIRGETRASDYILADVLVNGSSPSAGTFTLGTGSGTVGTDGVSGLVAADYVGAVTGQTATGLQALANPETIEFNILAVPGVSNATILSAALALVETRGDAILLIDPPFGLSRDDVIAWHNGLDTVSPNAPVAVIDSSYAAVYWSWVKDYDSYNKKNVWLPPSGYVAGVFAYTDKVAGPWYAPAGHSRGVIDGDELEVSPKLVERDMLNAGQNRINPIVSFPTGLTVFGNRTTQRRATDLDSVHVRRMLIHAEKVISESVKYLIFEPNDATTWRRFELLVNPILENIRANRGLERFQVVCDETTNPPAKQQQKAMNGKLLIQAINAAEIIELDFALFATGAEFTSNF